MPWRHTTVENVRLEFVLAAEQCSNFSSLCREFGITRRTGYKWLERYRISESLSDQSRAPLSISNKTPSDIEELILKVRFDNPGWGAKTIKTVLENHGHQNIPCVKTVNNILKRNNCIDPQQSLNHKKFQRFERERCNELWQTDFKGEFRTKDGKYCYPLTILDDHSRFSIKIKSCPRTGNMVINGFKDAFYEFGMPDSVLCDHGGEFAGLHSGYTAFEKWLMNHDILPIHGRVRHPQTQGKIERFHRTMKYELLKYHQFQDLQDADHHLQMWRDKYNFIRPHEALGMKCPGDVYIPSTREYSEEVMPYEYSGQYHVIKVNNWGYVRYDKWQVYLSETMIGEHVEFRPNPKDDTFFACYRNFKIAEFSAIDGKLIRRFISRV